MDRKKKIIRFEVSRWKISIIHHFICNIKQDTKNKAIKKQNKELNELQEKEKALKQKEKQKKQIILRLAPSLWQDIATWANDDFRSINSQIEYILTKAVKERKNRNRNNL